MVESYPAGILPRNDLTMIRLANWCEVRTVRAGCRTVGTASIEMQLP